MRNENDLANSQSRRNFLGQTIGAAGMLAALGSAGQAKAQTQQAGESREARVRDSFDFGWKFFKGDAQGAQQPDFADSSRRAPGSPCAE